MASRTADEAVGRARFAVSEVTRSRTNSNERAVCTDDDRAQRLRDIGWDDRADQCASDDALWR